MKEENFNRLDFLEKKEYERELKRNIKNNQKEGVVYSNEYINFIKNIPYLSVSEKKIKRIVLHSNRILGSKETFSKEVEKYYMILINSMLSYDFVPIDGYTSVFSHIKNIYDNLGEEIIERYIDTYIQNINIEKRKVLMNICINQYHKSNKNIEYIKKVISSIIDTNDLNILKNLEYIIMNIDIINNNIFNRHKDLILNKILINNKENASKIIKKLLELIMDKSITSDTLFVFLLNIYSSNDSEYKETKTLWNVFLKDKDVLSKMDDNLISKLIILSENLNGTSNDDIEKYKIIGNIILKYLLNFNNIYIRNYILEKFIYIKNLESLKLLNNIMPILVQYKNEKEIKDLFNDIEDREHNTKKLSIKFI